MDIGYFHIQLNMIYLWRGFVSMSHSLRPTRQNSLTPTPFVKLLVIFCNML